MEVVSVDNSEHYTWGGKCDGWHLVKTASLSVIQEVVPSGCSEVKHLHEKAEQYFYILSGVATLEVHEETYRLKPNQGLHIPAGVLHQLRNDSNKDLVFIVTSTPPSHGDKVEKK